MATEMEDGECWLPSDVLEDDYLEGLTRQMAKIRVDDPPRAPAMPTSPQSTLGNWSALGSPESPSTPFVDPRSDALETRRTREALIQQQLRVAHFYQLKQQQLMKQQYEAWRAQSRSRRDYEAKPQNLCSSAWPPLRKQQDYYYHHHHRRQQRDQNGSGMRAVFLNGAGSRRESAGTGVFLPRGAGAPDESKKKKPSCSTVLLPARVVQALNLNVPQTSYGYVLDHDIVMANLAKRRNNNHHHQQAPAAACHEIRLPPEWTY